MKHSTLLPLLIILVSIGALTSASAQTIYQWSDDGSNNSWNSSSNWRNSSGNIPDGTNLGAWFNYERNAGKKIYVTSGDGSTGTNRTLHTYKITGNSSGDNWRIYANKDEASSSSVNVTIRDRLETNLAGDSSANLYHKLTIADGRTITWTAANGYLILNQPLAGSGTLDGDNTAGGGMTLKANGSFSGTINTGKNTLDIDNPNALDSATINLEDGTTARLDFSDVNTIDIGAIRGSGTLAIGSSKTLEVGNSTAQTYSGVITGGGSIIKTGSGVWTLSGASTFDGDITVSPSVGNIKLGAADTIDNAELILNKNNGLTLNGYDPILGGLRGSGNLNLGANTLTINGSSSGDYTGILSGSGGLTVQSGSFNLNSASTYTGTTTVSGGQLYLKTSTQLPSLLNGISMSGGGKLYVSGTQEIAKTTSSNANNQLTVIDGGTLRMGDSSDWIYTGAFSSNFNLGVTNTFRKIGSGKMTLAKGNTSNTVFLGSIYIDAGTLALGDGTNSNLTGFSNANSDDACPITNNGTLELNAAADEFKTLRAHISGSGNLVMKSGDYYPRGWLPSDPAINTYSGGTTFEGGTFFVSDPSEIGTGAVTFAGGILGIEGTSIDQASDLNTNWSTTGANDIRIDIDSGSNNFTWDSALSHSGGFEKLGPGAVRFNANNTYTGDTTITEGRLIIGNGGSSGAVAGNIVNHTELAYNRTGSLTQSSNISGNGEINNFSAGDINLLDVSAGSGTITHSGSGELSLQTNIAGTRALVSNGTGRLTLTGAATHTGGTTIGGSSTLWIGAGASLGSHSGDIDNSGAVAFNTTGLTVFPSIISGAGNVSQIGSGTTTLTQNQTYTGTTTISDGTLELGDGTTHPTLATSALINNSNLKFNYDDIGNADFPVSGTGDIEKVQTSRLILRNDWTHTGTTTVSEGTLTIGENTVGWLDTPIINNGIVEFRRSDNKTFGHVISGTGQVKNWNTGVLTLTADNTYTGQTTVNSGEIQLGNGGTTGYIGGPISINNGSVFRLNRSDNFTLPGSISGNGTLIKQNANTVTLINGIINTQPATTISAGTLIVGNGGTEGRLRGDVTNNSILILNTSADNTHEGDHTGTGSFTKQGSGTATFSGALNHTGGTTISAGTLELTGTTTSSFQNDATFKFSPAVDTDYNQTVTGNGAFIKGGNQTLSFTNNTHTFAGGVTIAAGTLAFGNGGTAGLINQDLTNNATLSFNRSNNFTFAKVISGTGQLKQTGTGTTTLSKNHTYTGDTIVTAGTLNILYDGTAGTVAGDITNNSNLQLQSNSGTQVLPGNLDGSGATTKTGAGTTTIIGSINPTGTLTVNAGILSIGNGGTTGVLASNVTTNATLKFDHSNNFNHNYAIDGTGSVDKDGTGTLILLQNWTHSGGTTITDGTLKIGDNNTQGSITGDITNNSTLQFNRSDTTTFANTITGTGDVTKLQNAELILTGNFNHTGKTTISGGTLTVGNGGTTGSIASDVVLNGTLQFNRSDDLSYDASISGTGSLKQIGTGIFTLTADQSYTGITTVDSGTLKLGGDSQSTLVTNAALVLDSTTEQLIPKSISGTGSLEKTGSGNTTLTGTAFNTGGVSISAGSLTIGNGSTVGALTSDATVATGATLRFNKSNNHTHSYALSGAGALEQIGAGQLYIRGDFTHTGGTTISSGQLWIGKSSSDGSIAGDITNNAILNFNRNDIYAYSGNISGTGNIIKARGGNLTITGDWIHTGGTTLSQGTINIGDGGTSGSILGNISNSGALTFNRSDDTTFADLISGTGILTQDGNSTLSLTAANTYTGNTTINAGILNLDTDTDYTLDSSTNGIGALQKSGTGKVTLTKSATHSGGTTISEGMLSIGNGSNTPLHNLSNITNHGELAFNHAASSTFFRNVSGTGNVEIVNTNIMTLTGDWTHTGSTTITSGNLRIGNEGTDGWISGDIITNASLTFFRNDATTYSGNISGTGNVISTARVGNLTITGDWTHSGNTSINRGRLNIGDGGTEGWISGPIINNSNLYINHSDNVTYSNILSGTGKLYKQGTGSLELTGASTMTGSTTVETGTLIINNTTGVALNGSVTVNSGATLAGAGSLGSAVTCAGTVAPGNSPGTLTVGGNFNLTGTYLCEISDAANDRLDVGGTLTITNGEIDFDVLSTLTKDYYILATYNSLSGSAFATVTDLPVGYALNYDFNDGTGSSKIALVVETAPTLSSIALNASISSPTDAKTVLFDVTFDMPVTGVGADDFDITYAGSHDAIVISGSGAEYTVSIPNVTGDGTMTIGLVASGHNIKNGAQIDLTTPSETGNVVIDNTAPIITLNGDSTIGLDLNATWTDPGATTDDAFHTLTIVIGGDTVNTSVPGTYVITYDANDQVYDANPGGPGLGLDALQVTRSVIVRTVFSTWALSKGLTEGVNDSPTDNPDGDNLNNLAEFALDGDPMSGASDGKIVGKIATISTVNYLTLTFPVRTGAIFEGKPTPNASIDGVNYSIRASTDLISWTQQSSEVTPALSSGMPALSSGWEYRTFRYHQSSDATNRSFMSIQISETP